MKVMCGWIYAIDRYSYPPTIEQMCSAIREVARMEFKYVELEGIILEGLSETNLMEVADNKEKIKKLCDDLGMRIANFMNIVPNIVSLNENKREEALKQFNIGIETARYFGCEFLSTDSYAPPLKFEGMRPYKEGINYGQEYKVKVDPGFSWDEQWRVLVDTFSICSERTKKAGLRLVVEPRVGELTCNTEAMMRLLEAVGDDNFGVLLDTGHLHPQKEILPLSVEKLKDKVFMVHVSDNNGRDNEHLGLGKGTIDWESFFVALKKHRFNGYVGIDIGKIPDLSKEFLYAKKFLEDLGKKLSL